MSSVVSCDNFLKKKRSWPYCQTTKCLVLVLIVDDIYLTTGPGKHRVFGKIKLFPKVPVIKCFVIWLELSIKFFKNREVKLIRA